MKIVGVTVQDASDGASEKRQFAVATPNREKPKEDHSVL